jgi:FtsH-binding integral membrane protein
MSFFSNSEVEARPLPAGLSISTIMQQVYQWMTLGLVVTFGSAFLIANVPSLRPLFINPAVVIISLIAYLILSFAIQPIMMRASIGTGVTVFLIYTGLFGIMLSSIFLVYSGTTIALAFLATAATFGAMSVYGLTTKADLSKLGSILMMALIGLLIASIVNIFVGSNALFWIVNYAGVLIFTGMTAYDTWWIKNNAGQIAAQGDSNAAQRVALVGALHLFLDFVNLFLFILRILGSGRD